MKAALQDPCAIVNRKSSIVNSRLSSLVSRLSPLVFVCLLTSCAAEGPPRPPRVQRPAKVSDLAVRQIGRTLRLSFHRPLLATDGRQLTKPIEVKLFRIVTPPGAALPGNTADATPWVSLDASQLRAYTHGPIITYMDRLPAADFARLLGSTFSFDVVTLTRAFRGRPRESAFSNWARMKLLDVSPPIQNVVATPASGEIDLHWSAPVGSITGGPLPRLAGYRIYRSMKPRMRSYAFLAQSTAPEYKDRTFRFNQTYSYRVRAVFESTGYRAESSGSTAVSITPRDIFPPPAPAGLTAVYTGRSVQLIWKSGVSLNLAGYNVYRQEPGKLPERLNQELLRTPAFADLTARPGRQYTYWVTAVSLAHNESGPSAKVAVETR